MGSEGAAAGHIAGYGSSRVSDLDLAPVVFRVATVVIKNIEGGEAVQMTLTHVTATQRQSTSVQNREGWELSLSLLRRSVVDLISTTEE